MAHLDPASPEHELPPAAELQRGAEDAAATLHQAALPRAPDPLSARVPAKPWWRSRTLWFNLLVAAAAAAEAGFGALQPVLGQHAYAGISFLLVVGNALLRVITVQGIAGSPALHGYHGPHGHPPRHGGAPWHNHPY